MTLNVWCGFQELFKKSKEYSDIPDLLSTPKKGGRFQKKTSDAGPSKSTDSDDTNGDKMDSNDNTNGNHSNGETPVKKRKLDDSDDGGTPVKKEKTEVS